MSEAGGKRRRVLGPEDAAPSRIVEPDDDSMEEVLVGATLRPRSFDEYVFLQEVCHRVPADQPLYTNMDRLAPLETFRLLFYGPPGLGKTTLAALIAKDLGRSLRPTSGPTLERPKDLVGILTSLQLGDVLFIDEIHRLGGVVEEYLYPAMEDFRIDVVLDSGAYAKTYKLPVQHFTLIGATTRAGMLSAPLRERFGLTYHLDYYSTEELTRIVTRSAGVLGIAIDLEGAATIACRSRGTPRVANRLLRRVRDFAEVRAGGTITQVVNNGNIAGTGTAGYGVYLRAGGTITQAVADEALRREGVDALGLDRLDRAFLQTIAEQYRGGPVGLNAIAATLTEDAETLEDVVEPYLLKAGFVVRTASGRKVTPQTYEHLRLKVPPDSSGQQRLL